MPHDPEQAPLTPEQIRALIREELEQHPASSIWTWRDGTWQLRPPVRDRPPPDRAPGG